MAFAAGMYSRSFEGAFPGDRPIISVGRLGVPGATFRRGLMLALVAALLHGPRAASEWKRTGVSTPLRKSMPVACDDGPGASSAAEEEEEEGHCRWYAPLMLRVLREFGHRLLPLPGSPPEPPELLLPELLLLLGTLSQMFRSGAYELRVGAIELRFPLLPPA